MFNVVVPSQGLAARFLSESFTPVLMLYFLQN
jgi:hypothetical protein